MKWVHVRENWPAFYEAIVEKWPEADEAELEEIDGDQRAFIAYIAEVSGQAPAKAAEPMPKAAAEPEKPVEPQPAPAAETKAEEPQTAPRNKKDKTAKKAAETAAAEHESVEEAREARIAAREQKMEERERRTAQKIAERAGRLYDKMRLFVDDMSAIGQSLDKAQDNYRQAMKKLASGRGNLLAQTEASAILDQPMKATDKPQPLYPWACNHCGFTLLAGLDHKHVGEVARRHRFGRARAAFGDLAMQERAGFAGKHRVASRIFFCTSAAMLVGGIYMLASGTSLMIALPWLSFSGMYWIFGMTRSYRAWQVATGHLFVEGAARHWFSHERWLV